MRAAQHVLCKVHQLQGIPAAVPGAMSPAQQVLTTTTGCWVMSCRCLVTEPSLMIIICTQRHCWASEEEVVMAGI
jgi:hypothetical protein